jgi:hypothetical protein
MHAAIRLGARDLSRSLGRPIATTRGPARTLWSGRFKGWVSPAELRRINTLILELFSLLQVARPHPGRRLQSFTLVLAPIAAHQRAATVPKGGR